ncbi:MAG: glycosyltransferase [Candidatus Marinimicrobia bacterium]|nr:glycosyltransferase [Candidatus Neomarinimicrobiota bacterium]
MQSKINLLHLITGLGCGGAEKMVYQLCNYSDREKFNISVVSINDTDYFLSKLKALPINVLTLGLNKNPLSVFGGIISLNKFIRKHKIQIIHAHLFHGMVLASITKLFNPKIKIVWTAHSSRMISTFRSIITYCSRLIRDHDIILQPHSKSGYNIDNFSVIPNGVEFPIASNSFSKFDTFTFISVGSLNKDKNHIFLINLFSKIDHFNYKLLIVGVGPEEKVLQNKINELGLSKNIELLGYRKDVYSLMKQAHCFLLPSLREGLPLVILESAYAKLPIIASSIVSIQNLISEDEGYVVPLNEFEKAIYLVVNNYAEAEAKANQFYGRVKNEFDIMTCMENHEKLYRFLLSA